MPVACASAPAVFDHIRTGYNSAAGKFTCKHLPCSPAYLIQPFERNNIGVGCNLKHAVGRCIDYRLARSLMLIAEHLYYLSARSRVIAESACSYGLFKLIHKLFGKSVGIGFERNLGFEACDFPVPGCGILAL